MQITIIPDTDKRRKDLDELDPDLVKDLNETWEFFTANPDKPARAQTEAFTSKDVAEDWMRDARAWAYHHEPRIEFSGNPAKAPLDPEKPLPDTAVVVRFRLKLYESDAE